MRVRIARTVMVSTGTRPPVSALMRSRASRHAQAMPALPTGPYKTSAPLSEAGRRADAGSDESAARSGLGASSVSIHAAEAAPFSPRIEKTPGATSSGPRVSSPYPAALHAVSAISRVIAVALPIAMAPPSA